MAKYEDEKKLEDELKKSYQSTLIPEEKDERMKNEDVSAPLTLEDSGKKLELNVSDPASDDPEDKGMEPGQSGVTTILIENEMKRSYINYAMSVIVGRDRKSVV